MTGNVRKIKLDAIIPNDDVLGSSIVIETVTGAFIPPKLDTIQRDALTGISGMEIYNTDTNKIEVFNSITWEPLGLSEGLTNLGVVDVNPYIVPNLPIGSTDGVAQITDVTALGGGALDGTSFIFNDSDGTVEFYFNEDLSGTAAPGGADRSVLVEILAADADTVVANKLGIVMNDDAFFSVGGPPVGAVITVANESAVNMTDAVDVDSGFTIAVTTQGVDPIGVFEANQFYVVSGYGDLGVPFAPDVVTVGTGDWVLYDGANFQRVAFSSTSDRHVVGPTTSTDNAVALYDGTNGKLIKDSDLLYSASALSLGNSSSIVLTDDDGSNSLTLNVPADITGDYTITYPPAGPGTDQILKSDISGVLSWVDIPDAIYTTQAYQVTADAGTLTLSGDGLDLIESNPTGDITLDAQPFGAGAIEDGTRIIIKNVSSNKIVIPSVNTNEGVVSAEVPVGLGISFTGDTDLNGTNISDSSTTVLTEDLYIRADQGSAPGTVEVFSYSGGVVNTTPIQTITVQNDGTVGFRPGGLGQSMDISKDGKYLVVGDGFWGPTATNEHYGRIVFYEWNGSSFIYQQEVLGDAVSNYDFAHYDLAISDDGLTVVTTFSVAGVRIDEGLRTFRRSGSTWSETDNILTYTRPDIATHTTGQQTLQVFKDRLIVGMPSDATAGTASGAVFVYIHNGVDAWVLNDTLVEASPAADREFGKTVSLTSDGKFLAIAQSDGTFTAGDGSIQTAYIYKRNGSNYQLHESINSPDLSNARQFAFNLNISDNHLVVSDWYADPNWDGAYYTYSYDSETDTWDNYNGKVAGPTTGNGHQWGWSVRINDRGDVVFVSDLTNPVTYNYASPNRTYSLAPQETMELAYTLKDRRYNVVSLSQSDQSTLMIDNPNIGNISGPASHADQVLAIFDGVDTNTLQPSSYTIPLGDGTNGQVLVTDGSGAVTWGDAASGSYTTQAYQVTADAGTLTLSGDGLDLIESNPAGDIILANQPFGVGPFEDGTRVIVKNVSTNSIQINYNDSTYGVIGNADISSTTTAGAGDYVGSVSAMTSDTQVSNYFSSSMDVTEDGEWMAIAYQQTSSGHYVVSLWRRDAPDATSWTFHSRHIPTVTNSTPEAATEYRHHVNFDREVPNVLYFGHGAIGSVSRNGGVLTYTFNGTSWDEGLRISPDSTSDRQWANTFDLSGDWMVMSATASSLVQVYKRDGAGLAEWTSHQALTHDGAETTMFWGSRSVVIAGENHDIIAVSDAWSDSGGHANAGRVGFYHRSGDAWSHFQSFSAPTPQASGLYGKFLSAQGNYFAVNGNAQTIPSLDIFHWNGASYERETILSNTGYTQFGITAFFSGDASLVAISSKVNGSDLEIWERTGSNSWSFSSNFSRPPGPAVTSSSFGFTGKWFQNRNYIAIGDLAGKVTSADSWDGNIQVFETSDPLTAIAKNWTIKSQETVELVYSLKDLRFNMLNPSVATPVGVTENNLAMFIEDRVLKASEYTMPVADGITDQILQTDGAGVVTFIDIPEGLPTDATNANRILISDGTDNPTWTPYEMPAADGTALQFLQTDGAGAISFVDMISAGWDTSDQVTLTAGSQITVDPTLVAQKIRVQGTAAGGAISLNVIPFLSSGVAFEDGIVVRLLGLSATDTVELTHNDSIGANVMFGDKILGLYSQIEYQYDLALDRWIETWRNN